MAASATAPLVDALRQYRLLEPEQLAEVTGSLQTHFPDAKSLATELIRRKWLTPYQANQLLLGKGQSLLLGSYLLLERLGEGGMGQVFKARNWKLGRTVALKLIRKERLDNPEAVRRFQHEILAAAALSHANIVLAYDADHIGDTHLLVMEHIEGATDLSRLVKQNGPLPVEQTCEYIRQAALGLQHAFERGMVHRDIKPANLLLTADRKTVKILDMGLARLDQSSVDGESSSTMTREGTVMGTPDYIAPEQAVESHTVDIRADLYSLGCTFYFLLTGRVPFPGGTFIQKINKHQFEEPKPLTVFRPDVPPGIARVVRKLMAKKPENRYQTPAEVASALASALAAGSGQAGEEDRTVAEGRPVATAGASADSFTSPYAHLTTDETEEKPAPRPEAKSGRGRTPLLIALGLLALVPLVWWLATVLLQVETTDGTLVVRIIDPEAEARIKNGKLILTGPDGNVRYTLAPSERNRKIDPGPYKIHVEGADGLVLDTPEFTLEKGGKATVRVTVEPKAVVKKVDPDHEAAKWVLSIGGTIRVNGLDQEIQAAGDLPLEAFRLTSVDLHENKQVSDAGLACFKGCMNLTWLNLGATKVSGAGLANFAGCKNLEYLDLSGTGMSDVGLAHFAGCKSLKQIYLFGTQVSDKGLTHFAGCKNLTHLGLANTKVSDKGLAHFADCKNLTYLGLSGTEVGDKGLAHFAGCKNLTELWLQKTKVTRAKVEELQKALPMCKITWEAK